MSARGASDGLRTMLVGFACAVIVVLAFAPLAARAEDPLPLPSITGTLTLSDGSPDTLAGPFEVWAKGGHGAWLPAMPGILTYPDGTYSLWYLGPGVYRVGVSALTLGPVAYPPAFFGGVTSYTKATDVTVTADVTTASINIQRGAPETLAPDAAEPDNMPASAKMITAADGWVEHTLCGLPDNDWVRFRAVQGRTYSIETSGSVAFPTWGSRRWALTDTYLALFGSDGATELGVNDDANGAYSALSWTAPASGVYFARVTSFAQAATGNAAYGAYTIRLLETTAAVSAGTLSGHVYDASDGETPVRGAHVQAQNQTTHAYFPAVTDATGKYSLANLPVASYRLDVKATSFDDSATITTITVSAGATSTQDIHLTRTPGFDGRILGSVQLAEGPAATQAVVTITGSDVTTTTSPGPTGLFVVEGLGTGEYDVDIACPGYRTIHRHDVRALGAAGSVLIETLAPPGGAVSGRVTDTAGKPISAVRVAVGLDTSATTSADGAFTLPDIASGTVAVAFSRADYVTVTRQVDVSDGSTATVDVTLARPKVTPTITRTPSANAATYTRKKGTVAYKLSAKLAGTYGVFSAGQISLQYSSTGTSGWKTLSNLTTDSSGSASKTITATKAMKRYYRWYAPATSAHFDAYSSKMKVTVK